MMKPHPRWIEAIMIITIAATGILCYFLADQVGQYHNLELSFFTFITIIITAFAFKLIGRREAMTKYSGIAIKPVDIRNGLYLVEDILTGQTPYIFRTIILSPYGSDRAYHVADSYGQLIKDSTFIGKVITVKNGVTVHVAHEKPD